jgi:predicted RNA-binding Zn ribbon-like protein
MATSPLNGGLPVTLRQSGPSPLLSLPLVGNRPCLDFLNTVDWRLDPARRSDALRDYSDLVLLAERLQMVPRGYSRHFLGTARLHPDRASRAFSEAISFRDSLAEIIDALAASNSLGTAAGPPVEALIAFDGARRRARTQERIEWDGYRLVSGTRPEQEGLDWIWLILVRDADELLFSDAIRRIRVCASEGCGWAFLDTTKNGARRWCSMRSCGNTEKSRRFRAASKEKAAE